MPIEHPGSDGEHALQERYGTFKRAAAFYDKQMLDHLNPLMKEYLARQEMAFISTSDVNGECDASFRAGPPGFVRVLDDRTLIYPEYRGNGVLASLGNMSENPHIGMLFVDFFHSGVGLHINGRSRIIEHSAVEAFAPMLRRMAGTFELEDAVSGKHRTPERWVMVEIVEAYIHCSKHIPILAHLPGGAGYAPPSGDHFRAKDDIRPWTGEPQEAPAPSCAVDEFYPAADSAPAPAPAPAAAPVPAPAPAPGARGTRAPEPLELSDGDAFAAVGAAVAAAAAATATAGGPGADGHVPAPAATRHYSDTTTVRPPDQRDELGALMPPAWENLP
jgi:predicted pyridoxine 5'-phosphate oxidase superfamily flavin-nucleotide-binding protein